MPVDTKKLEALVASVELGSFTRAAEQLGITKSLLQYKMKKYKLQRRKK